MKRLIISIIAAIIINAGLYSLIANMADVPVWITTWYFKFGFFILLVWAINAILRSISSQSDAVKGGVDTVEGMKLDRDVRQAILDRSHLAGKNLADALGKLDDAGMPDYAEKARKARLNLDTFAKTLNAQPTAPGPESAGMNVGRESTERIVLHDKNIMAIIEEMIDDTIELVSINTGNKTQIEGILNSISEQINQLMSAAQDRESMLKGIK